MSDAPAEVEKLRAELLAANRAREVLLASVAHDLRNPLNTFAMSAGLLRDDLERDVIDAKRALSLLARMDRASSRMQSLIDDLVEASRIEAKKVDVRKKEEPVAALLADAVASAKPTATEKGVTLDVAEPAATGTVTADRARFFQIIQKLVGFAVKAVGDGASVQASAVRTEGGVTFTLHAKTRTAVMATLPTDEGRGGLPLLIARGLVEAHGGTLQISAAELFSLTFTLPTA